MYIYIQTSILIPAFDDENRTIFLTNEIQFLFKQNPEIRVLKSLFYTKGKQY